ncbi:MAG: aldehyde dehydrogenase family protein [Deltaproteobacteria bacterium]|nr:aldehyde dehydrogenase family protein [Deltaproteobacteria bacterium]
MSSAAVTQLPGTVRPADGSPLEPVAATALADIPGIVAKARAAQPAWAALPLDARAEKVRQLGRALLEKHAEAAKIMAAEMGRSELECIGDEIMGAMEFTTSAIGVAKIALKPVKVPISKLDYPGKRAVIEAVPRGVVGIIAPWNYPLGNFFKHLFPTLLAGNAVVLKPSEHTPRTGAWLAKVCSEIFPAGLVGLVQGRGDAGQAILEAGIDAICFTGSVATGKRVSAAAGERLIPCSVELGGKDAAIVLADCDLERTIAGVANWSVFNAGQDCSSIERVYVEAPIADAFATRIGKFVGALRVTPDPMADIGTVQNARQLEIIEAHVKDAVEKGAKLLCGGARTGQGLGFQPTVLDGCTEEMRILREETFGPVVCIRRVKDADEAVRLANDSPYGLNGSVWTTDIPRGEALARRLECGVAVVNNHSLAGINPWIPWTGVKDTGPGVANSVFAYPTYVRRRTVYVDSSKQPDPWWKPVDENFATFSQLLIQRGLTGGIGVLLKLGGLVGKRSKAIRAAAQKTA